MTEKEPNIPVKTEILTQLEAYTSLQLNMMFAHWRHPMHTVIQCDFRERLGGTVEKDNSLVFTAGRPSMVF